MPTSRKRKPNKHPKKVIKERVIKFVGKLSEKSKSILSPQKKRTSPKTLKIQEAKTAQCKAVLFWDSSNGPYVKSE